MAMELGSRSSDVVVYDGVFNPLHTLGNVTGGLTFAPVRDVLYVVDTDRDALVALETDSWSELYTLDIGEDVADSSPLGNGVMTTDDGGALLFLSTASGVRVLPIPEPSTLVLLCIGAVGLLGYAWGRRREG